jgi:Ice-binding-like
MQSLVRFIFTAGVLAAATMPGYAGTSYSFALLSSAQGINAGSTDAFGNVGAVGTIDVGSITNGTNDGDNAASQAAYTDFNTQFMTFDGDTPTATVQTAFDGDITTTLLTSNGGTNVYSFVNPSDMAPGNVVLDGPLTLSGAGTYIFLVPAGFSDMSGASIVLTNGASAANIFWVVDGEVSFSDNITFNGAILSNQGVNIRGGGTFNGSLLTTGEISISSATDVTATDALLAPEPGSAALAIMGLVGIGLIAKRRAGTRG